MGKLDILIKRARVVDPSQCLDTICDIGIADGVIKFIGDINKPAEKVISGEGLTAMPGLVDMHTHMRDPGQTQKEDIITGSKAAAAGGVTTVAAMPNTVPATDSEKTIKYVLDKGKQTGLIRVLPIGSMTVGQKGEEISDFAMMKRLGVTAVSEDGKSVKNANVMKKVMENAKKEGLLPICHCEDLDLVAGGVMNEGVTSKKMGVLGNPSIAEEVIIARDILLAAHTDSPVHIAHVSSNSGIEIVRAAKRHGIKVTCETAPHYFTLTDEAVERLGADAKMNPPLRSKEDLVSVIEGIKDGIVDAIVTDHAPHTKEDKSGGLSKAANGIAGLETSFALSYTALVKTEIISLSNLIMLMSTTPAELLNIPYGTLKEGAAADIVLMDLENKWTVDKNKFNTKGRNTPFDGMELYGRPAYTICGGKIVFKSI